MIKAIDSNYIFCSECKKLLTYEDSDVNKYTSYRDTIKCPNCGKIIKVK